MGVTWTPTLTYYIEYPQGPAGSREYTFTRTGGAFAPENKITSFAAWISQNHSDQFDRPEYIFASDDTRYLRAINASLEVGMQNGAAGRWNYLGKSYTSTSKATEKQVIAANGGKTGNSNNGSSSPSSDKKTILYHYTNEEGQIGILSSKKLNPSLKANNPKDARYGDGQYLSDIQPGTKTPSELSRAFLNVPFQGQKFTKYVAIDVTGLNVQKGRDGVFVIPNSDKLDLTNRIVGSGSVANTTQQSVTPVR